MMNNFSHEWEQIKHIKTRYMFRCKNCGEQWPSKNGTDTKKHTCGFQMTVTAIPFCTICEVDLSLKQEKLEKHYLSHSPMFAKYRNKGRKGKSKRFAQNSKDLCDFLSKNYKDIISRYEENFDSSNNHVKQNLIEILSSKFPKVEVYTYGSREIGTGTQDSDLDVYVDTDKSYYVHGLDKSVMESLEVVENILRNNPDVWCKIEVTNAKVPIITARNKIESVTCDLSFSDGLAHSNTKLIKIFCDEQPLFRDMIIYLGEWLKTIKLSDHINKYTLRLLIMNYLQCSNLLPSIKTLQDGILSPAKIGEWNVDFDENKIHEIIQYKSADFEEHIKGFFKLHSTAKRFNGIISTYLGSTVLLDQLQSNQSFHSYVRFINKYGVDESYVYSDMNVQGPFNLADNPAKQVSKQQLKKFIDFSKASDTIRSMQK